MSGKNAMNKHFANFYYVETTGSLIDEKARADFGEICDRLRKITEKT